MMPGLSFGMAHKFLILRQKVGARNLQDLIAKVSSLPPMGCRLAS
jgi:hypothetical protein